MDFHPIRAQDRDLFDYYFRQIDSRNCDMCFSTMYMWGDFYGLTWTCQEDMLIVRSQMEPGWTGFYYPIGSADPTAAIRRIEDYCKEEDIPVRLFCLTRENEAWLNENMPGAFQISWNRDVEDYIYEKEKLVSLSGRKYHGKKNHVNKFRRACPDWTYETIDESNLGDCLSMLNAWKKANSVEEDYEKHAESCIARNYLLNMDALSQKGGLLRTGGEVVAFTIGEKLNSDTFVVHIEKAFSHVPGAYAMINQQFLLHEAGGCRFVNREDDAGEEGLRQAKMSYHPVFMIEKGMAVKK